MYERCLQDLQKIYASTEEFWNVFFSKENGILEEENPDPFIRRG